MAEAKSFRELGNEFFRKNDYEKAIEIYAEGITSTNDRKELSLLYSNRAQCYLCINYPIYALGDTWISFQELDSTNIKTLLRMATAYYELQDFEMAKESYFLLFTITKEKEYALKMQEAETKAIELEKESEKNNPQFITSRNVGQRFKGLTSFDFIFPKNSKLSENPNYYTDLVKGKELLIVDLKGYGKSLIADRDFKKGEQILREKPFISCTLNDRACDYCLKLFSDIKKQYDCPKCGAESYCDQFCAENAWNTYHKSLCGSYTRDLKKRGQNGVSNSAKIPLIIMKLYGKIRQMQGWPFSISKVPIIESLSVSSLEGKFGYNSWKVYLSIRDELALKEYERFDFRIYLDLYFKLFNNAFQIKYVEGKAEDYIEKLGETGLAVFPIATFINHSCLPNAGWITDAVKYGDNLLLLATQDIKKGEQIFISYIPHLGNFIERQKQLLQYSFKCSCMACEYKF